MDDFAFRFIFYCGGCVMAAGAQIVQPDAVGGEAAFDRNSVYGEFFRCAAEIGQRDYGRHVGGHPRRQRLHCNIVFGVSGANGHAASMAVPVEIHGHPPEIAFNARYLADALKIGGTVCLSDELSPGICRHPTGRFCVIMPMRVTIPASTTREVEAAPPNIAKAA